ncbi:MAG: ABC transporter substrate-binding protein [Bacillota bacterium]|nr:ABC transporter substrate-binding protein [Bacillota bacterium]
MKRGITCLLIVMLLAVLLAGCNGAAAATAPGTTGATTQGPMKVMLYSSMKDDQLAAIKAGFTGKYPNIKMDYYTAGTGDVITKITTEQQAGGISADLIWIGDPTHYVDMKAKGLLETYVSPEAQFVPEMFRDPDNQFCGARIVTMGFVYNTQLVKPEDVPKTWEDLLDPRFKDQIGFTDPTFSGTALTTLAGLTNDPAYGWAYLEKLKENGLKLEKGSSSVVTKVGAGEYQISIGADYIARTMINQGSTMGFLLPESGIPLVASPIAIFKGSNNMTAAKILYDYILSEDGQSILVDTFTSPVRIGMKLEGVDPIDDIASRAFAVDEVKLISEKQNYLDQFDGIFKTNG